MLPLSSLHRRLLRTRGMTPVVSCPSAPALWRGALWFSTGFAVLAVASLTLRALPPAAQQAGPPAPQASRPKPYVPRATQADPPAPQATQATPPAPQATQAGPPAPAASQPEPRPGPLQTPPASQTAPAEQAPPAAPAAVTGGAGVGFRLENADLLQFVNLGGRAS